MDGVHGRSRWLARGPPVPVREKFRRGHLGVWGMGRREASRETCEHGSYFRLKDENPASRAASLNLPGESALGEDGTSGHTFPDLFPPLADSPSCYILSEDLDPSRKNGRSHTSFASYWREGTGLHLRHS